MVLHFCIDGSNNQVADRERTKLDQHRGDPSCHDHAEYDPKEHIKKFCLTGIRRWVGGRKTGFPRLEVGAADFDVELLICTPVPNSND